MKEEMSVSIKEGIKVVTAVSWLLLSDACTALRLSLQAHRAKRSAGWVWANGWEAGTA